MHGFIFQGPGKVNYHSVLVDLIVLLYLFIPPLHYALNAAENNGNPPDSNTEEKFNDDLLQPDENDNTFKIRGYYKNLFLYNKTDSFMKTPDSLPGKKELVSDLNRVRLSPLYQPSDNFFIQADIDNEMVTSTYGKSTTFNNIWGIDDYDDPLGYTWVPYESNHVYYRLKINRAFAKYTLGSFTFTLGRQLVRYGSGRLWNPLDILNPLSPTSIEGADEQKGIDALRVEFYPTTRSEISLVYSPQYKDNSREKDNMNVNNDNIICRYRNSFGDTDVAVLAGRVVLKSVYGADIATIVYDGMLRGSVLYTVPDTGSPWATANAGYEYTFISGIYLLVEQFYNRNCLNKNDELMSAWTEQQLHGTTQKVYSLISGQFITYNQHYTGCEISKDITPLLKASCYFIIDFQGGTVFFSPSVTWNPFENIELSGGVMSARVIDEERAESDFGTLEKYPYIYASFKWYF